jgi:hypothetical protein
MLAPMGNGTPARNQPFLSTAEMFRLKAMEGGQGRDEYVKLETARKREILDGEDRREPIDEKTLDLSVFARPSHVEDVEWFASASDLCRAMDWLGSRRRRGPPRRCAGVLAINPGLSISKEAFPYIGYKGGSETGVINLTYLLRAKDWDVVRGERGLERSEGGGRGVEDDGADAARDLPAREDGDQEGRGQVDGNSRGPSAIQGANCDMGGCDRIEA